MSESEGSLSRILRGLYRRLVPSRAKNTLRLRLLFDERDKPPRSIERFDQRSVLVLAPHMDDEVIGCGGAVRRHVLAGADVTTVFFTDGTGGDARRARSERPDPAARTATRKQESRRAAELLGTGELIFLDQRDGELDRSPELAARLTEVLQRVQPEVLYLPSVLDTHLDHWAVHLVLADCGATLASLAAPSQPGRAPLRLRQYEVWTPLVANAVVDITDVADDKRRALEVFASQRDELDVVALAEHLNRYRSIHHTGGRGHAEAFYESELAEYQRFLQRVREPR